MQQASAGLLAPCLAVPLLVDRAWARPILALANSARLAARQGRLDKQGQPERPWARLILAPANSARLVARQGRLDKQGQPMRPLARLILAPASLVGVELRQVGVVLEERTWDNPILVRANLAGPTARLEGRQLLAIN